MKIAEKTLLEISEDLARGKASARSLLFEAIERIDLAEGEGAKTFLAVHRERAHLEADYSDQLRAKGQPRSALEGIPISLKDLFDEGGEVTRAGSTALEGTAPALQDCPVAARLRAAGAIIVGRTNMTEFAFSGLGLNPHYGTPKNPYDRETGRIPGGSSSGAAISVTDGMAAAAIGTDTGGSVRIPSALCGLTGFKPTQRRIPLDGVFPLSSTLDSVGPLARSVACGELLDSVMAGESYDPVSPRPIERLCLAVPQSFMLEGMDETVAKTFETALRKLSKAGASIEDLPMKELLELPQINSGGGFATAESFAFHRQLMEKSGEHYDPRVKVRIERGAKQSAADYIDLLNARKDMQARVNAHSAPFDALIMPTVPLIAPPIADLENDEDAYHKTNILMLRNPSVGNFLDRCAISLPCHESGAPPVGLMLMGETMGDKDLLSVAKGIERVF